MSEEDEELDDAAVGDHRSQVHSSRPPTSLTDRACSYSGTHISGSDRRSSYGTGATGSEYTYGSGSSYLTGSDLSGSTDRRTSYGSTIRSTLGGTSLDDSIEEGDEGEGVDHEAEVAPLMLRGGAASPQDEQTYVDDEAYEASDAVGELALASPDGKKPLFVNTHRDGYDSGLGSDLPTAAMSSYDGSDYFRPGTSSS